VKLKVDNRLIVFPVAAGTCDPQEGTEFFTTVHVLVAVDEPFVTDATSVLLPGFSELEREVKKLVVWPTSAEPFSAHEIAHPESFGTMPYVDDVDPPFATRTVAVDGKLETIEQTGETDVVHAHSVES
jgi:hypothetical protein